MMKIYKAFGLVFHSELDLPELQEGKNGEKADVYIRYGKVPELLQEAKHEGIYFQAAPGKLLFKMKQVAKYLVKEGREIIIENEPGADLLDVRVFIYSTILGALLQQRKLLILHGSAVEVNGKAIIFGGVSGMGKSTLAAYFVNKKHQLVTDDIALVKQNEMKECIIHTSYPFLKLWEDTIDYFSLDKEKINLMRNKLGKYYVPFSKGENSTFPVHSFYEIRIRNIPGLEIMPLSGFEKFAAIKSNMYRFHFIKGFELMQENFIQVNDLVNKIKIYRIYRPEQGFHLEEMYHLILQNSGLDGE